jgi:hypothetical protein
MPGPQSVNGFGKGLLPKPTANSIYKLSGKKIEPPIILERKMRLNNNTKTNLANKEILISTTITPDHSNTQPNTVTFRTSTRKKCHLSKDKMIFIMKEILSLEDSNIRNQHNSSVTNNYLDFKLNPPSYIIVNSALKYSSNNLKFYHHNIRDLKRKIN